MTVRFECIPMYANDIQRHSILKNAVTIGLILMGFYFLLSESIVWGFLYNHAHIFLKLNYVLITQPSCKLFSTPHASHPLTEVNTKPWKTVISEHISTEHAGWIIAKHPVQLGLCNRFLDTASLLILAIATNRTLWIDWEEQPQAYLNDWEQVGMTSFDQLFNLSLNRAELKPPEKVLSEAVVLDRNCLLYHVATSADLNADLIHEKAVISRGYDWWGGLLLQNPHYKKTIFNGLNFSSGFPVLFKTLFPPKSHVQIQDKCSWIIQYRVKRPRPKWLLRPIDDYIRCATLNGMTSNDYNRTWIITDDVDTMLALASPQSRLIISFMNIPYQKESCRGPCGDTHAVDTIYKMSGCKHAVLTFGSSFGSCITSLAGIHPVYRVGRYGDCSELPSDEPYDMNTVSKYGNEATYISKND